MKWFPSPPLSPKGRLFCVWLRQHSKGKARLHTAGEAEAAEPSTDNGVSEGGGRGVGCSEPGSLGAGMVGAREGQKGGSEGRAQALVGAEDGERREDAENVVVCIL